MKTPLAEIKVNGKPVATLFNERLISVTIVDKEGVTSDTISCELNDSNPFADIPKKGDTITASLGYVETGLADFGSYTADDPEVRCLPFGMTVNGKGANVRDQAKQHRSRHWDKKTVKEIVEQIAGENGLSPVIDGEVGAYQYEWFGQQDESDLHVVERLARRHDALFSIKDGRLIFAKKGSGQSASGKELTAQDLWTLFENEYRLGRATVAHQVLESGSAAGRVTLEADVKLGGRALRVHGAGNGPIDAFIEGLARASGQPVRVLDYHEHAIASGADARAVAYLELRVGDRTLFGVGMDANIVSASLKAIVSGLQRAGLATEQEEPTWQTN